MSYTENKKLIGLDSKTTPIDADVVVVGDTADSDRAKKTTWANIKATLKTYLDTLYSPNVNDNQSLFRQAIINGNFDVWQRGTSLAVGAGGYTADRWYALRGNTTAGSTVSRQDGTGVNGSYYCTRVQRDSGNSSEDYLSIAQYLEGSTRLRGKKVTLSFYARKGANYTATSDILAIQIATGTAEDSKTMTGAIASSNITLTTSWQLFTLTTSSVIASNVASLRVYFQYNVKGTAGAADYFEIAQVQLCAGSVALPFQPKSFAEELRDCQRYYQKSYASGVFAGEADFVTAAKGMNQFIQTAAINASTAGSMYFTVPFKVSMRSIPTVTLYSIGGTANAISLAGGANSRSGVTVNAGWASESGFGLFDVDNTSAQAITANQNIQFHYVATSEL